MTVNEFVDELSSVSLPNVFNPYRDVCDFSDDENSPRIRCRNLSLLLDAISKQRVSSVWLGRDLGYRGGRRTGIALTDEVHLALLEDNFGITGVAKATIDDEALRERTATHVWKMLCLLDQPILPWNAFPFHPFDEGKPLSNRRHTAREFDSCRELLMTLLDWLRPTTIVALGADAEWALKKLGYPCCRVRHPSYGGQKDFAHQIREIYDLEI